MVRGLSLAKSFQNTTVLCTPRKWRVVERSLLAALGPLAIASSSLVELNFIATAHAVCIGTDALLLEPSPYAIKEFSAKEFRRELELAPARHRSHLKAGKRKAIVKPIELVGKEWIC